MFRNYLVTALRNFARHKLYSFINVAGLTVGLACAIFIVLFLCDELSYDKWISGSENLYRAEISLHFPGQPPIEATTTPFPLGPAMKTDLPEVVAEAFVMPQPSTVSIGDKQFAERPIFVSPNFFSMIHLPLVSGDPKHVFDQPDSIVLSQAFARKYFGGADPLGKVVVLDETHPLTVTGIMRDLPHNTQLDGDIFITATSSANRVSKDKRNDWFAFWGWTYVQLAPGTDPKRAQEKMLGIFGRHIDPRQLSALHARAEQVVIPRLVTFRDVHLTTDSIHGMRPGGSWTIVYGFAAIAVLILLIACFNFMNLATARATMRAREVSLRKVVGARRDQLIVQFLGESVLVALIAAVLALSLVEILLPAYDAFLGRPIAFHEASDWPLTLGIFLAAVIAGLLGGLYPALVLSGFRPAAILKTSASGQNGSGLLRTSLVVAQFAISIGLGIAALVVFRQIGYARNLDLGFNRNNIVVLGSALEQTIAPSAADAFMQTLRANPAIAGVARSSSVPFEGNESRSNAGVPGNPQQFTVRTINISPEFPAVYGMKLLAGRFLSRNRGVDIIAASNNPSGVNDGMNVLIDETAARMFGFTPSEAIGAVITLGSQHVTVAGVVQNALFGAAQRGQIATLYYSSLAGLDSFSIRVKGGRIPEALAFIDTTWHRFAPNVAIRRHFLDDSFDKLFTTDERQGTMFAVFVGIAIFIACLGLFGLAAFTAERRTKEIGIRKAFGARSRDIVRLLLWQFSVPVLLANLIAWPVAWYYLHAWLESYAYRIILYPVYFATVSFAALFIAWATVSAHAVRVARANPVHALRYE